MQSMKTFVSDQLKFAKQGAENLARMHHYRWINWRKGPRGRCTAGFEREGEVWSFDFYWTPKEPLEVLADKIEKMDYAMQIAMREFASLKLGAMMKQAGAEVAH
jgi:hypothetical protein